MLAQLIANGLVNGAIYSIVALGFSLVYNTTGIFHIAHGAVYAFSSYIFYTFYRILNFPLLPSFLLGLFSGVLLGIFMEVLVYRPLFIKKTSSGIALVSSIGINVFIVNLIALLYGNETKILFPGIQKTFQFGGVILTRIQVAEFVAFIIIFSIYFLLLRLTNFGKLIRAYANNPTLLSTFGVEVSHLRVWIFAVGSLFAGIASCLVAIDVGMDPNVGMPALLVSAVSMIVGGIGIFESAAIGGFLIGVIQSLVVWQISARWQEAVTFALLIVFLLFRPQGVLGRRKRIEEI